MDCPKCGKEMIEQNRRIEWETLVGTSESSVSSHSKMRRVWYCKNCNEYYGWRLRLVIVKLVRGE